MRRFGRNLLRVILLLLLVGVTFAAFWFGIVPQRLSPFSPIALETEGQWFVDPKLAALRRAPALCDAALKAPAIEAGRLPDIPVKNGCGATNSVRISTAGGARLQAERLTCEMAAALALWLTHDVQRLAREHLGRRVASVQHMGTYACRNILGSKMWTNFRSQHATANAIDISGFTLDDGRQISVLKGWVGDGPEARFLRAVHAAACRYFRVSLGPEFNALHRDHFHFDRGPLWTCR